MKARVLRTGYGVLSVLLILAVCRTGFPEHEEIPSSFRDKALRLAIDFSDSPTHLPGLSTGYNYELMGRFAASLGDSVASVRVARGGESFLDSLRAGSVDILALPFIESAEYDSVRLSIPIDSLTVWAVGEWIEDGLEEINSWIEEYSSSEGHEDTRDSYLLRYSPAKRAEWGRKSKVISPYDSLVKQYSTRIGWDWRLLSAVIYQESQFHIEAVSPKGAEGLMQMIPRTAHAFGVDDLLNPEENIKAGTAFLARLQRMFRSRTENREELLKFTLAAFNAGEGRLTEYFELADSLGVEAGSWDQLVGILQENGSGTAAYVDKVLSLYGNFRDICPE